MNKRITKSTFKAFLKKNQGKLLINKRSQFDGMIDGVEYNRDSKFVPCVPAEHVCDNNLGIQGVWLVNGSRDSFTAYDDGVFQGIYVYNCCGSFIVAVKV